MPNLIKKITDYYNGKLKEYGITPQGVDWNSEESQLIRFKQLSKVITAHDKFSILDYGCGYGALLKYLIKEFSLDRFEYTGFDISSDMISAAMSFSRGLKNVIFTDREIQKYYDFVVASGVFNVKLEESDTNWNQYVLEVIENLDSLSTKGFAFNALTIYSDKHMMKDHLYYADPKNLFDHCKRKYSRNVALMHDYDLFEFTLIVRK